MNCVINPRGRYLCCDSFVDKAYRNFQSQYQELDNRIRLLPLPNISQDVAPLNKVIVTIESLKGQLRVMAKCVQGIATKHRNEMDGNNKVSPRPKDFVPDVKKIKVINLACGVLDTIAKKIDAISDDYLSTPSPIDDYKELQVDEDCEATDVFSRKSWSELSSMQQELIGLVSEVENFLRHFLPSSGGVRNYEMEWKYRGTNKEIEGYEELIDNLRDVTESQTAGKRKPSISPRADSLSPNLKSLIQFSRVKKEQDRIKNSLLVMRETLQTAQISEVLCALDPPGPRVGFREKQNDISEQMKLLCEMLEKFKAYNANSVNQKVLWILFGGEESLSLSIASLESMIIAIQQISQRFSLIEGRRGLNDFRRPTDVMYEIGLQGLTLCSQLQCKLLLECNTVWNEVDQIVPLIKGARYKPVFCTFFKDSTKQINNLKLKTYPLFCDVEIEKLNNNEDLINQLAGEVRKRYPNLRDFASTLNFLDEFQQVCESQLDTAVKIIQDAYNVVEGGMEGEFRLFEELIALYNVHHRKQMLVINSLRRFF